MACDRADAGPQLGSSKSTTASAFRRPAGDQFRGAVAKRLEYSFASRSNQSRAVSGWIAARGIIAPEQFINSFDRRMWLADGRPRSLWPKCRPQLFSGVPGCGAGRPLLRCFAASFFGRFGQPRSRQQLTHARVRFFPLAVSHIVGMIRGRKLRSFRSQSFTAILR